MPKGQNPPYMGAAYYPELWQEKDIDEDIVKMKKIGFNLMRIGEFAWGKMEPQEGKFCFDWLKNVLDKLYEAGIDVILCTPTATPPEWLTTKYPEVLLVGEDGRHLIHGARRHNCPTNGVMREKNRIIVTEMASRFGNHPAVKGWQIDNEIYVYGNCYCKTCVSGFRKYLKDKFGTVEAFNRALDLDRWSISYSSFESVLPPQSKAWMHPTMQAFWFDYQNNNWIDFVSEQADIIRKFSNAPIGTDSMTTMGHNFPKLLENLDIVEFNHYNRTDDTIDGLSATPMWYDYIRTLKKRPFWITETQPNWKGATYNSWGIQSSEFCYVNTWLPFAYGGEMNLYWHWRSHPAGHEVTHGAVLAANGRFNYTENVIRKASGEIEKCSDFLKETSVKSDVAIHLSYDAWLCFTHIPYYNTVRKPENYFTDMLNSVYKPLAYGMHVQADMIDETAPLDGYKVLFSPFLPVIKDIEKIKRFVENGGIWIVGPASDLFNAEFKRSTEDAFYNIEKLAGIYCKYQLTNDNLPCNADFSDGTRLCGSKCFDGFEAKEENVIARYTDGILKDLAAVTCTDYKKGKIIVLGTMPTGDAFEKVMATAGIKPEIKASKNLAIARREGSTRKGMIVTEMYEQEGTMKLCGTYNDLISGKTVSGEIKVSPSQVLVLEKLG